MTILNSEHENKFKVANVLLQQGAGINSINTLDGLSLPPRIAPFYLTMVSRLNTSLIMEQTLKL